MKTILCCKFPTTTLLADDNPDLHLALSLNLPPENGPYCFVKEPQTALNCLQKQTPLLSGKHISYADCSVGHELHFKANLGQLKCSADVAGKVSKVSVVLMDYQMPGMTGIEIFERLNLPNVEKILLTGYADEKLAVDAFNRRLINRYIAKQDPDLIKNIIDAINIGKRNYFQRSSETLYNLLTADQDETAITDPVFIDFFHELNQKLDITEYYLLDGMGSFLMFDSKGMRHKLNTYTKDQYLCLLETLPAQHRSIKTIKGRQLYHCTLNGGLTPIQ